MRRLLAALLLLPLAGCAGAHDANDLLPILTASVSQDDGGALTLTAEAVRQTELEGAASSVYLTAQGDDPDALFRRADALMADALYFSHARTFVVDETVAADGLRALVDSLVERGDVRLTLRLVVARGVSAEEIVRAEAVAAEIAGEALGDLLDLRAQAGNVPDAALCDVYDALLAGRAFALPALTVDAAGRVVPAGQAGFRLGRLTGFSGGETDA